MTTAATAAVVGLLGPWAVARLTRGGASPRLAVAAQLACLLLAWSGVLVLAADVAAPHVGVVRACASIVSSLARGDVTAPSLAGAVVYAAVAGRTVWCIFAVATRSRMTVASIRSFATFDGTIWRLSGVDGAAFTAGLVRPLVIVSDDLMSLLDADGRGVVVAHEQGHAAGRHTVVDLAARALAAGLAPWPGARLAMLEVRRHLEAAADDHAARRFGAERVARAIARVAVMPSPQLAAGTLGAADWPLWRVQRLLDPVSAPRWRHLPASAATASSLLFGAQGAAHALLGAHLLPVARMCPL